MRIILSLFFFTTIFSEFSLKAREACVLVFLPTEDIITRRVLRDVRGSENIYYTDYATPQDILNCVTAGVKEITIIAHTAEIQNENVKLIYRREVSPEERDEMRESETLRINERLLSSDISRSERNDLRRVLRALNNPSRVLYQQGLIYNRVFEIISQSPQSLERIRFAGCHPEYLISSYPGLENLQDQGIDFDFAPINQRMSRRRGKSVTSYRTDWFNSSEYFTN